jgi:hypothetical protein
MVLPGHPGKLEASRQEQKLVGDQRPYITEGFGVFEQIK